MKTQGFKRLNADNFTLTFTIRGSHLVDWITAHWSPGFRSFHSESGFKYLTAPHVQELTRTTNF